MAKLSIPTFTEDRINKMLKDPHLHYAQICELTKVESKELCKQSLTNPYYPRHCYAYIYGNCNPNHCKRSKWLTLLLRLIGFYYGA